MSTAAVAPPRRLSRGLVVAYGFGAVAYGVKDTGFGGFLLFFYNQVMGLPQATVSFVIMAALLIDAAVDPMIGFLSDRTRSRWGRRHPWMYASALPIMMLYVAVWSPPSGLGATGLLVWLFAIAVLMRSAVSAYEVPSVALTPELTGDYDERTRVLAWRYLWGWAGVVATLLAIWLWFLAPAPGFPDGKLNPAGYYRLGIASALLMGFAILVSALATHREIPKFPKLGAVKAARLRDSFGELRDTLRNRAFAILMTAGVLLYTNQGVISALGVYTAVHIWGFHPGDFVMQALSFAVAASIALLAAPWLGRRGSKPKIAAAAVVCGAMFITVPYWLRFAGLLPPASDPVLPFIAVWVSAAGTACNISGFILAASMMADVVEDSELRTGRRDEGVFFAGSFFMQKCTSGIGIFGAGVILSLSHFPARALPGQVSAAVLDRLALVHASSYLAIALVAAFILTRFPFGRTEHQARLALLAGAPTLEAIPQQV
ncbi:MFS transporter [Sphingomonas sp.]|uniref:MFS transporter n=1 Tax=Sphingomonas sp. TaxID=28214 RepID=UPI003CC64147